MADGTWSEIDLAGHPCHLFEPAAPSLHSYTVIYLHGIDLDVLRGRAVYEQEFARHGLRVICPVTGRCWWNDRICPEFDPKITAERYVLDHVVAYIAESWGAKPPRLAIFGTSMGGQGALRMAYKHPDVFPVVAALAPSVDFQRRMDEGIDENLAWMYRDAENARQDTATLHIHPLNWPRHQFFACDPTDERWWESADRLRMKLYSLGVPFECDLETEAGGHTRAYFDHMAPRVVEFIADRLEKEHLRII